MKKVLSIICLLALAMTACQKQEETAQSGSNTTNDNNVANGTNTFDMPVKKYLVKEYFAGDPSHPTRVIEWNEDFTRITHITTQENTIWQLDYDFVYYENDSMRVVLSQPDYPLSSALTLFSDYTCHFDEEGRISSIDYFYNTYYQSTQKYNYDQSGKLISVVDEQHNIGLRYVWEGDNVCEARKIPSDELEYSFSGFTEHFHPDCTLPYLLADGNGYAFRNLTEPLWKNWYSYGPDWHYEHDEDGYVTCSYRINEEGERTAIVNYEYAQKRN